jgi:hypothetical protein
VAGKPHCGQIPIRHSQRSRADGADAPPAERQRHLA